MSSLQNELDLRLSAIRSDDGLDDRRTAELVRQWKAYGDVLTFVNDVVADGKLDFDFVIRQVQSQDPDFDPISHVELTEDLM